MKELILIRGIPGSGKSTLARNFKVSYESQDFVVRRYEADMFFEDEEGEYVFNPGKLGSAHAWCERQAKKALLDDKVNIVIISNTFTTSKEIVPYWNMSVEILGKFPRIVDATGEYRSIHNVPEETINRMKERFVPTEKVIELLK